ncbi:MAG: 2-oxoglutarate dehydrogenase, E2 component, dihydrolipoamide succinyltransferase, partial [Nocardioidaceae bacterium]
EALLEVSTDKVDTEIPSPVAGTLLEIKVAEDETVAVGAELAIVGGSDGDRSPEQPKQPEQPDSPQPAPTQVQQAQEQQSLKQSQPAQQPPEPTPSRGDGQATSYVTPLVRKLAAQHDVDLSDITGTGVGGRIRKQDVLAAAQSKQSQQSQQGQAEAPEAKQPATLEPAEISPLRGKTEKLSRLRKTIAARMVESLQVSAQLTTVVEVDVTGIARLRDRVKDQFQQREGVKLSFLPFFAKAAVDALKTYPMVNASIDTDAGTVSYHGAEHLGVAVDTERGLLVPVIKDAGDLSIAGLARKIADLASRTRDSKITPDELSGGTFTLTNTGSRGALFDTPIINQPQVAILGTGTVVKRAVVIDDANLGETIAIRRMVYLALTYDHRIVDGADAARFLTAVKQRLEEAKFSAELGL